MSFADDLMQAANALLEKKRSNITEAMVLIANPASLPKILRAKEEAERWSRAVSYAFTDDLPRDVAHKVAKASRTDGPADALRHCYLAAMLGRDLGYTEALTLLTAHEMNSEFGTPASRMDLHNNAVGLEIGVRMKTASDTDLTVAVVDAFLQGRLRVLDKADGGKLVPTRSLTFGR
jgi:hypothetical protein